MRLTVWYSTTLPTGHVARLVGDVQAFIRVEFMLEGKEQVLALAVMRRRRFGVEVTGDDGSRLHEAATRSRDTRITDHVALHNSPYNSFDPQLHLIAARCISAPGGLLRARRDKGLPCNHVCKDMFLVVPFTMKGSV